MTVSITDACMLGPGDACEPANPRRCDECAVLGSGVCWTCLLLVEDFALDLEKTGLNRG